MNVKADLIVKTILTHLKDTKQMDLIAVVVQGLTSSTEYKNAKHQVLVSSASKLDSVSLKSIELYLAKSIGQDYQLTIEINPDLLAGFTLQIDDTFIDASVLGKINTVSNILTAKD